MTKARDIADYGSYGSNPNVLINGSMVINQRGVVISAASVGEYGPDRWKRTAGGMTQIVEEGNFKPSTVHTLSGDNVTEQQVTSPASGHWTLPDVPITATNIKLEEGIVATPYQLRNKGEELSLCQRYYQTVSDYGSIVGSARLGTYVYMGYTFPIAMRSEPTLIPNGALTLVGDNGYTQSSDSQNAISGSSTTGCRIILKNFTGLNVGNAYTLSGGGTDGVAFMFDAEL